VAHSRAREERYQPARPNFNEEGDREEGFQRLLSVLRCVERR
jgi:hypothetical protein